MSDSNNKSSKNLDNTQIALITGGTIALGALIYYAFTRSNLKSKFFKKERTLALILPEAFSKREEIKHKIVKRGFVIIRSHTIKITREMAGLFFDPNSQKEKLPQHTQTLIETVADRTVDAIVLEKDNCIQKWTEFMGPLDPEQAKQQEPDSIRAIYGPNSVHGSSSTSSAARDIKFFFDIDIE